MGSLLTWQKQEALWGYVFLIPFLIGFLLFILGPVVASFGLSFTEWNLIGNPKFVGLANYRSLIDDNTFKVSLINTLYYTGVSLPITIAFSLFFAIIMNRKLRGINLFRAIYFLPVTISVAAVGLLWAWIFSPDFGILNYVLHQLGLPVSRWIADSRSAMPSVIIVGVWRNLGFNILVLLAGLQNIDHALYEAAEVDGASAWVKFRSVTLPMLSPVLFFVLIIGLVNSFQVFEQTYIMTQGGPGHSTFTLVYYIFQAGFQFLRMGSASAMSFVLFVIVFLLTALNLLLQSRWVYYE